mgnify:CR=1 FL=1
MVKCITHAGCWNAQPAIIPQRVPVEKLKRTSTQLAAALPLIQNSDDPEQLRGLEGEAAQRYFDCLNDLILQQKQDFCV